ncbi:MAG: hypothetical protein ACLSVD_01405 [Eggerthellaceae bacterium]
MIALLVGFFLSATGVMAGLPFAATAVFYGVLCGSRSRCSMLHGSRRSLRADAAYGVYQIVGGLIVQCVLVSVLPLLGLLAASVLSIVAVVVSACLLVRLKRMLSFAERDELLPANRGDRLSLLQAFLCLFVLVGVVGILHTTVLGSQSESIVGDVNMWMPLVAATAITALVGLTMRHPNPRPSTRVVCPRCWRSSRCCRFRRSARRAGRSRHDHVLRRVRHGVPAVHSRSCARCACRAMCCQACTWAARVCSW